MTWSYAEAFLGSFLVGAALLVGWAFAWWHSPGLRARWPLSDSNAAAVRRIAGTIALGVAIALIAYGLVVPTLGAIGCAVVLLSGVVGYVPRVLAILERQRTGAGH